MSRKYLWAWRESKLDEDNRPSAMEKRAGLLSFVTWLGETYGAVCLNL